MGAEPAARVEHTEAHAVEVHAVEVHWSGPTMQLTYPFTGKVRHLYQFVVCLRLSPHTFVEPTVELGQDT